MERQASSKSTFDPLPQAVESEVPGRAIERKWINPIGGLGDQLMLAGVLKLVHDRHPDQQFNLVRRTHYLNFLKGHPAIAEIGYPSKDAPIQNVDYWSMAPLGGGDRRAFQVLARAFGLETPVEERLWIPCEIEDDPILFDRLPWKSRNVLIAPASDSPRKVMSAPLWHELVARLKADDIFVAQVGRTHEQRIRNAYSLLGLTTPKQAIGLVMKFDAVVTSDNFIMHSAHLVDTPAVVVWGATRHAVYGYERHIHFQTPKHCGLKPEEDCVGADQKKGAEVYGSACPIGAQQCMNLVNMDDLYAGVLRALQ